eukprot:m.189484 g.189484  ORF g.189484 m.189484 type:complete len:54 (-) comp17735_c0_seq1:43-204(-)
MRTHAHMPAASHQHASCIFFTCQQRIRYSLASCDGCVCCVAHTLSIYITDALL